MSNHQIAYQMQNYISNDIDMDCLSSITTTEKTRTEEENLDLRRGPWTVDEDLVLINYISMHGEGRWNSLARSSGLKRTGKSCRLRWLNYLRPDVKRGDITPEEQLVILELHSRWGNRWSKIAQHLPGRTDNEIKNYWRTRVQKHAKQLKCDVNSKKFKDAMRYLWMPRLIERIKASSDNNDNLCNTMDSGIMQNALRASTGCPSTAPVEPSRVGPSFESSSHMVAAAGGLEGGDGNWGGEVGEYWCDSLAAGGSGDFGSDGGMFDFDWGQNGDFGESLWSLGDNNWSI